MFIRNTVFTVKWDKMGYQVFKWDKMGQASKVTLGHVDSNNTR